jgi:hypothetical protein
VVEVNIGASGVPRSIEKLIAKFEKWSTMPFEMLQKEADKVLMRCEKLNIKDEARRLARESRKKACESRSKSIPHNATIRREFVRCKKLNCHSRQHGPYYYAYWKDPETKVLKKKYIGKDYFPDDLQEGTGRKREYMLLES